MALDIYAPPTSNATLPTPRRLARNGYVAHLGDGAPSNSGATNAGWGTTPTEAIRASCYWANQLPWVRVVRYDRAPAWACEEVDLRASR